MEPLKTPVNAQLFINGKFVNASDDTTFDLNSPYSGEHVGRSMASHVSTLEYQLTMCSR